MKSIGIATVVYSADGKVISARFEPKDVFDTIDLNQLRQVSFQPNSDGENLMHNAEMVMAGWFVRMNEIETADRDKFKITSKIISNEYVIGEGVVVRTQFLLEDV